MAGSEFALDNFTLMAVQKKRKAEQVGTVADV
jgi:hypothetical protein